MIDSILLNSEVMPYNQDMKKKGLLLISLIFVLSGCGQEITLHDMGEIEEGIDAGTEAASEALSTAMQEAREKMEEIAAEDSTDSAEEESSRGILTSKEDIQLTAVDSKGTYSFIYAGENFTAIYTTDNWKIKDSYKITSYSDITIICEALSDEHQIHGLDRESYRTPDDMAFEWQQHNIAYELLPEDSDWKKHAKDVDLDPKDQGKTFYEMYEERTGN